MTGFRDAEMMELLTGVSRSFVLTIRALPRGLRRPVGLAYLLARASDTMADTARAPVEARIECLRGFAASVAGTGGDGMARLKEIAPENEAERYLLGNLDRVTGAVEGLDLGDREEIVALMQKITRGQELDLARFSDAGRIIALKTAEELESQQAEVLIMMRGHDESFGQSVHARFSYRYDEIVWGAKFATAFELEENGDLRIEVDKVSLTMPAELPGKQLSDAATDGR